MLSFREKIKKFFGLQAKIEEAFFEDLADLLIEGDFGAAEAWQTVEELRGLCKKRKIAESGEARETLASLLAGKLLACGGSAAGGEFALPPGTLQIILLLGVNGVGKTTSAAKLASRFRERYGRKPILAAADTFRAAAIEQLKIHGERLGVRVVAHQRGGDPAAVIYDAIEAARAGGGDLIIADTAGRMHTKNALVEELKKIDRVVETKAADTGGCVKWLVLDATTGRNALAQAEVFHSAVKPDGVILTKYDSTARGGVVFSLAGTLSLPVIYICDGEKYEDIRPFDASRFAGEFTGLDYQAENGK
ncbi:MAG: signal recognition particle-docking protein FtsY [Spirochaetaceae bacterium]|jgi:fused signal recognition particle receptor|nr:signal recognition particle-docking protein FtsY [Spirochaetaceae bacterium]